jgi:serine/threonine-protein kinase
MNRFTAAVRSFVPYLLVSLAGFVVAYSAVFVWLQPSAAAAAAQTRVPDVVGMSADDAAKALEKAGYAVRPGTPVPHPTIGEGKVIAQTPAPGSEEPQGAAVSLTVSAGNRRAVVPALIGLTRDSAERELVKVGLTLGEISERPSALARGTVLDSRPVPGALVGVPSAVGIVLSAGAAEVLVPDVLGQDISAARAMLEQLGLVADSAGVDRVKDAPAHSVVAQAPDAGAKVPNGTKVRLTLAAP